MQSLKPGSTGRSAGTGVFSRLAVCCSPTLCTAWPALCQGLQAGSTVSLWAGLQVSEWLQIQQGPVIGLLLKVVTGRADEDGSVEGLHGHGMG